HLKGGDIVTTYNFIPAVKKPRCRIRIVAEHPELVAGEQSNRLVIVLPCASWMMHIVPLLVVSRPVMNGHVFVLLVFVLEGEVVAYLINTMQKKFVRLHMRINRPVAGRQVYVTVAPKAAILPKG